VPLSEILKAIKSAIALLADELKQGNVSEAERLAGLLDYLIDKAMKAEKQTS